MDRIHHEACARLEEELTRVEGMSTILVVGDRCSGKTTVCETVMRRMGRHVIRWTPYHDFIAGKVSAAYSGLDTIVFVDDADVLVRLTKGSSVGLMDAISACERRPGIRILMTALHTKGRVWRSVASKAGVVQIIPSSSVRNSSLHQHQGGVVHAPQSEKEAWTAVLRASERAVTSKRMRNWCDARDADIDAEARSSADCCGGDTDYSTADCDNEHARADGDDAEGCAIRKIALLLSSQYR